jgi:hypothetical protein
MTSRGLLHTDKSRTLTGPRVAVDDFGELPERKRVARARAGLLGHDLGAWHRRPNDAAGRFNAFCRTCNRGVVVCTEAPEKMGDVYGRALEETCR